MVELELKIDFLDEKIKVSIARLDAVFGATFVVISLDNPIISKLKLQIKNSEEIKLRNPVNEIQLGGIFAINPFNNKKLPIFISNIGNRLGIPAHDEADFEFAKNHNIEIVQVIAPIFEAVKLETKIRPEFPIVRRSVVYVILKHNKDNKYLILNILTGQTGQSLIVGGKEDGEDPIEACRREVYEETGYKNLKYIRKVGGEVHTSFFAMHKNENRYAAIECHEFHLINEEKDEVSEEEMQRQAVLWLKPEEISIPYGNHNIYLDQYFNGEKPFLGDGIVINSKDFSGLKSSKARTRMIDWLEENGVLEKIIDY